MDSPVETSKTKVIIKYFSLLECFLFNQAADALKVKSPSSLGQPWTLFLSPLLLLAASENIYYSLTYLEYRWIRKFHLHNMYTQTLSDLNKAARAFKMVSTNNTEYTEEEKEEFKDLINQTGLLVSLRIEIIIVYRSLAAFRGSPEYDSYIQTLSSIKEQVSLGFTHNYLTLIKYNLETEISVLLNLLKVQVHLGNYDYKESIFLLYSAKSELDAWRHRFSEITASKSSDCQKPLKMGVYHWLHLLQGAMHSKLTFYFHDILERNERMFGGDIALMFPQLDINYYSVIENFVVRSQCNDVCLVMDASTVKNNQKPTGAPNFGYQLVMEEEELQGLRSWPCIFHFPRLEPPRGHWPNIVSLIMSNTELLDKFKEPFYYHDAAVNYTYYISKIEPRLFVVIMFNKKKKKSDQMIQEFLFEITSHLRNWKIFLRLKPLIK